MTVTRYKKQPPASELIRESVMGVINHAPKAPAEPAKPAEPAPVAQRAPLAPIKINPGVRARIRGRRMRQAMADEQNSIFGQITSINPFQAYNPPPGVLPPGREPALAMDSDLAGWASDTFSSAMSLSGGFGAVFAEGLAFLGYAYLSELTLRPEYRRMGERIGTEMTRKWIRLTIASEGEDDTDEDDTGKKVAQDKAPTSKISIAAERTPQEEDEEAAAEKQRPKPKPVEASPEQKARERKLRKINERMKQLDVRGRFKQIGEYDCWMGRSHLYIDTGDGNKPDELLTDLGDGANDVSKRKFKKGSFKALKHIEPVWCYPVRYNATDPLADDWYRPDIWFAMQKQIHRSRLLTFVGREVPDLLKPAYAFGGLSLSQMAKPYVDNWLRTRQAVTDLIESFSVSGIYTNAQSLLQGGGEEVVDRIEMFAETRQNLGSMVLDKETEEFFNVSTPLGTLDALQAQSQEQLSSVSGIPLIVLLGITPTGLNASSEGELRVFYDLINAMQELLWRYKLQTVINFVQLDLYGEVDPAIGFEFEPLWSLDEKGQAEVRKIEAETHTIYVDLGAIGQGEVRSVIVSDENSPYNGLPPEDLPDLAEEEEKGLVVKGGKAQGGEGGDDDDGGGANDAAIPFLASDAEFVEFDHPRDTDGKFGSGGGSGKTKVKAPEGISGEKLSKAIEKHGIPAAAKAASEQVAKVRSQKAKVTAAHTLMESLYQRIDDIVGSGYDTPDKFIELDDLKNSSTLEGIEEVAKDFYTGKAGSSIDVPEDELKHLEPKDLQEFYVLKARVDALYPRAQQLARDLRQQSQEARKSLKAVDKGLGKLENDQRLDEEDVRNALGHHLADVGAGLSDDFDISGEDDPSVDRLALLAGEDISEELADELSGRQETIEEERAEEERWDALSEEEQEAELEEQRRKAEADQAEVDANRKTVISSVLAGGWKPTFRSDGGLMWNKVPEEIKQVASSPDGEKKLYRQLNKSGVEIPEAGKRFLAIPEES